MMRPGQRLAWIVPYRLVGASLLLSTGTVGDAMPVTGTARADIVYSTVFLDDGARRWVDAPVVAPVQARTLRLIPAEATAFSMVELRCAGVRPDGSLVRCTVSSDPASGRMDRVGGSAAQDIRIDPGLARSIQGKVRFISLQLRVSNSPVAPVHGPCWPPGCVGVPVPPPLQPSATR